MCKCTPAIRTPFCGKDGCKWPHSVPMGVRIAAPKAPAGALAKLDALYAAEINFQISTFWDAGYTVKVGDAVNGFRAEDHCLYGFEAAVDALWRLAVGLYPGLDAPETYPLRRWKMRDDYKGGVLIEVVQGPHLHPGESVEVIEVKKGGA